MYCSAYWIGRRNSGSCCSYVEGGFGTCGWAAVIAVAVLVAGVFDSTSYVAGIRACIRETSDALAMGGAVGR